MAYDYPELTEAEAALWREVSEMNAGRPESWLCFENCGHSIASAKTLFDRGMVECEKQMGMTVCRVLVRKPKPAEITTVPRAVLEQCFDFIQGDSEPKGHDPERDQLVNQLCDYLK